MNIITRRNVGNIQIILGIILFAVTIFGLIWSVNNIFSWQKYYTDSMQRDWAMEGNTTWDSRTSSGVISHQLIGDSTASSSTLAFITLNTLHIIGAGTFILFVLSIMFILQGLANISRK